MHQNSLRQKMAVLTFSCEKFSKSQSDETDTEIGSLLGDQGAKIATFND